jgi:1,4-dihydroxy-6-naphthoate synthase
MKLTLGFSPCPNDTFIFDALVNQKIDTQGFEFETILEDVETLNEYALNGKLAITKLSFPAFFKSLDNYILLRSGSALGKGVGPLLVQAHDKKLEPADIANRQITLPGINTTANLLFSFAYPEALNKTYALFSAIENSVLENDNSLGVIIHENRFTYQEKGLHKVLDLGEYWESKMHVPIPLGGIAIKRDLDPGMAVTINRLIKQSLEYAFAHYPQVSEYVKQHAQAMEEQVMRKHIDLYVNQYSLDLGTDGEHAIHTLYQVFRQNNQEMVNAEGNTNLILAG